MAFQIGIKKISGTYQGVSFYHSMFGWLVRIKGGPTTKQFKTSPRFARSRENSSEFTNCVKMASLVRGVLIDSTGIKDRTLYHRLIKLMRMLADEDKSSKRGERKPEIGLQKEEGRWLLNEFYLEGGFNLENILKTAGIVKESKITKPESVQVLRTKGGKRKRSLPVAKRFEKDFVANMKVETVTSGCARLRRPHPV